MNARMNFLVLVGFLALISGCSSLRTWNISHAPESLESTPLSTVSKRYFLVRVEDNRAETELGFVGYRSGAFGKAKYTSKIPPREIISDAIIDLLSKSGHHAAIDEGPEPASLLLSVKLNKFLQDYRERDITGKRTSILLGHINADIALIDLANDQEIFRKSVNTIDSQPFVWNLQKRYEAAYSKHIKRFLDDVFLDFELIGALREK